MDPEEARQLLVAQENSTRRALDIRKPLHYVAWAVAWGVGFGGLALTVHGQYPYRGPSGMALLAHMLLMAAAYLVTAVSIRNGAHGIFGVVRRRANALQMMWGVSMGGFMVFSLGLIYSAHNPSASGVVMGAGFSLMAGMMYAATGIALDHSTATGLGVYLVAVSAVATWFGPYWVCAVVGGLGALGFIGAALKEARKP